MANDSENHFGGVPLKLLKNEAKQVHKFLKSRHFQPKGHVQYGNMPMRPVVPSEENVEVFHDGTVQLCLHYEKTPSHVGDSWWLDTLPEIFCDVFVVFKVLKSGAVKFLRYEVALGWTGCDAYFGKDGSALERAYEKPAKRVNRDLDRMMKRVRC